MKLTKRLEAICDFIPKNCKVIDIGTDHGYVPIYLTKEKKCKCIATDISKNSLSKAIMNAKKANVNITFICTNGLDNIELNDEILIISGMGTKTILDILNVEISNDLVISTNNDVYGLIAGLLEKNYYVFKKTKIFEHKDYEIIYFKKSNQ